jgi:hypothetical protein
VIPASKQDLWYLFDLILKSRAEVKKNRIVIIRKPLTRRVGGSARGGYLPGLAETPIDFSVSYCSGPVYRGNPDFVFRKTLDLGKVLAKG